MLPLVEPPLPGEAWAAWLCRMAETWQCSVGDLVRQAGLAGTKAGASPGIGNALTPADLQLLAERTGLAADVISAMHLQAFHAIALRTIDQDGHPLPHPARMQTGWALWTGAKICPPCLLANPPRVLNRWRLGFAAGCDLHQTQLVAACPNCGHTPLAGRGGRALPAAPRLRVPLRYCRGSLGGTGQGGATLCLHDLAADEARPLNPEEGTVESFLTALLAGQPCPFADSVEASFTTWRALTAALIDNPAIGSRLRSLPRIPGPDSTPAALGAVILQEHTREEAAGVLRELVGDIPASMRRLSSLTRSDPLAGAIVELARRDLRQPRRWVDHTLHATGRAPDVGALPAARANGRPWTEAQLATAAALRHRLHTGATWAEALATGGLTPDRPRRLAYTWRALSDADRRQILAADLSSSPGREVRRDRHAAQGRADMEVIT